MIDSNLPIKEYVSQLYDLHIQSFNGAKLLTDEDREEIIEWVLSNEENWLAALEKNPYLVNKYSYFSQMIKGKFSSYWLKAKKKNKNN